jgi:putative ABC transport system substrate-binding protein
MMDRRAFISGITLGLLAAPLAVEAQQTERVRHIGVLSFGAPQLPEVRAGNAAFEQALQGLGWVSGRNLSIEYRYWGEREETLPFLCGELIRAGVELIVAITSPAAKAAKDATTTNHLPVVILSVNDPVALGLVQSLSRPGGNVTGLSTQFPELSSKRLQLLRELLPGVTRVAVLWNMSTPQKEVELKTVQATAEGLGMNLQLLGVRGMAEIDRGFDEVRAGGLIVLGDPVTFLHRARITALAAARRVPAIYDFREYADAGGLVAYGPNILEARRRGATFVDKILKGARPGDLPIEQPTKFELVINLKTAKALGLTIPPSLLARADHVIE